MQSGAIESKQLNIPDYSIKEDKLNSFSHGLGVVFGVIALILCLNKSLSSGSVINAVYAGVYAVFFILTFLVSAIYHSLKVGKTRKVFRIIDHSIIYAMIAGTYTPFTLIALSQYSIGKVVFVVVWAFAIIGTLLNIIDLKKFQILSCACYVVVGWCIVVAFDQLIASVEKMGVVFLFIGGVIYTIGAILYAIGSKKKYFHTIFHLFVLVASIFHFISIYGYVL